MGIKRDLRIFWLEHGDPFKFWIIVFGVTIFIVQSLNVIAIKKNKQNVNSINNNTVNEKNKEAEEIKSNKQIINNFINFCKENNISEAYNMLSENCKNDLFPMLEDFKQKYYSKFFDQNIDIKIEFKTTETYTVKFYDDILKSGKIENRKYVEQVYKIENDTLKKGIYINYNINEE